jgi:hypothetical protein
VKAVGAAFHGSTELTAGGVPELSTELIGQEGEVLYRFRRMVDAYALKELKITSECLMSLTNGLHNLRQVHEIARVTVMKYWYDAGEPQPPEPDPLVAESPLDILFCVQWSVGQKIRRRSGLASVPVLTRSLNFG